MNIVSQTRQLPRDAKVLLATNAVNSFGAGLVFPFLWIYLTEVRALPAWVPAVTMAIQAVAAMAGGVVWGAVLDRVSYRAAVLAVMLLAGLGTSLYAVATTPLLSLVAAVVYGLGLSGVGTSLRTIYAAVTGPEQRGAVFSLDFAVFNAMTGLGGLVGGAVAAVDFAPKAERFALLYLGDGLTFVLTGIVAGALMGGRGSRAGSTEVGASSGGGYLAVLRDRRLLALYGVTGALLLVSFGEFRSGLPAYLTGTGAVDTSGLSLLVGLDFAVILGVQVLVMPRLAQVARTTLLAVSAGLLAGSWACILLAGQLNGLAALSVAGVGLALMGTATTFVFPVVSTLVNNLVQDHLRGRANALLSTTLSATSALGPLLAGATVGEGYGVLMVVLLIVLSLLPLLLTPSLRRLVPADRVPEPAPESGPEPASESAAAAA